MKSFVEFLIRCFFHTILWFRYKIEFKGLDNLTPETLDRPGGVLFLPNHPAVFVDPLAVTLGAWKKFPIRPMVVEYFYFAAGVHSLMKYLNALPIPNFTTSSNSLKKRKSAKVLEEVIRGLRRNENFLIYPAGSTKSGPKEVIGGASGLHRILTDVPETNIVLVRVKGLWGSRFSRYWTGRAADMFPVIKWGVKQVLKSLLFFAPRRKIIIEYIPAPDDFPRHGTRHEVNRYLEDFYNQPDDLTVQEGNLPGDSLILRPYTLWSKTPEPAILVKDGGEVFDMTLIPQEVQDKVVFKLSELSEMPAEKIKVNMTIAQDVGLDSLDTAELSAFLSDVFEVSGVPVSELTTVGKVMALASKQATLVAEPEEIAQDLKKWLAPVAKERAFLAPGETIAEVFLNIANKHPKKMCMGDDRLGALDYQTVKLRALVLAEKFRHFEGDYVGILLPASVAASLCILACQIAGKVPLMINWTVGPRHLKTVKELTHVKTVISSWAFTDKLEGVDFHGFEDNILMLEDLRREVSFSNKLKAFLLSRSSTKTVLNKFNYDTQPDDAAVLLFTSGTENNPKGVPLSQKNILFNIGPIFEEVPLYTNDTLFGILPPFHSFGFTVSTMLPILAGVRVVFYPKPTDGPKLAERFNRWKISIMCGAPTFLKGLLKAAKLGQLDTMRLCVTGAEKAPDELFKAIKVHGDAEILEGYGITECSPILTLNRPNKPHKGVGQPLPGVDLMIVHPETYEPMGINTQGLILAKGPSIFSGYLNPGIEPPFVEVDGFWWYKTGDLGSLDHQNFLTISGRQKRFIKIGGEMASLSAIEDALVGEGHRKKWPMSEEAPSLAITAREVAGEKPKIFLFSLFPLEIDQVNQALKEAGFSNLMRISQVIELKEIPIMGTGKINYRGLEKHIN